MEFMTYWPMEDLPSKLYRPSLTPRPSNRCVNYEYVNFDIISISYFGIILALFSLPL